MNIVVSTEEGLSAVSPEVLAAVDRLAQDLDRMPDVGKVIAISDPLRQINGALLHDPSNPLPTDAGSIEQYLLLLESSSFMRSLVTSSRTATNVWMRVDNNGSDALLDIGDEVKRRWEEYGPPGTSARATGIMYEFARAEDAIAMGQLLGLAVAVGAIGGVLLAFFGDVRLALIALIPNAIPVCMAFGAMGLAGVPLDAGTVMVGGLALGIAVDDTVHLVVAFLRERSEGFSPQIAIDHALSRVLEPVVYTTVVVAAGFLVLAASGFALTRNLGLLTSAVMVLCLVSDILLLPTLLVRWGSGQPAKGH
jgi:predicted RND superfamily exporter protein